MTKPNSRSCPTCGSEIPEDAPEGLCPKCVLLRVETTPARATSPAARTAPPIIEEIAEHFPELEILELIGAGGMGAVYKARQRSLDRLVALKILSHDLGEDPAFAERFSREARVLAKLSHPNIVNVFDTGTTGPFAFLLMEFVDGVNLRQAMQTGGFAPSEALALVQDICAALKFAHEEGILHRDIKPENILIDSRGHVKIADFGIAKLVGEDPDGREMTLTLSGSVLGSPQYMAPEQIETPGDVDQRADIYSLGVVFYEMLTGELPLGRFALPSEKSQIDARIDEIVLRTLAKEREARFQTAGEVRTEVEALTSSSGAQEVTRNSKQKTSAAAGAPPRFAFLSAILAGVSLLLGVVTVPAYFAVEGMRSEFRDVLLVAFWALVLILAGAPAVIGCILGVKSLEELRESTGPRDGYRRAMFGALTLPVVIILLLTGALMALMIDISGYYYRHPKPTFITVFAPLFAGASMLLFLIRFVSRWANGRTRSAVDVLIWGSVAAVILVFSFSAVTGQIQPPDSTEAISKEGPKPPAPARAATPEVNVNLTVGQGLIATYELIRTDAVGEEQVIDDLQGFVLVSDQESWQGNIQLSTVSYQKDTDESYGWHEIRGSIRPTLPNGGADFKSEESTSFDPKWKWDTQSIEVKLLGPGRKIIEVASQPDLSQTMFLRINVQPRQIPGIPKVVLDDVQLENAVCGLGDETAWTRYLLDEIEMQSDESSMPPRSPEPEWREGRPESHVNLIVDPGYVAMIELKAPDGSGERKTLHRGYIVASDLEPWVGKLRVGSLANSSEIRWRIDGPFNTIEANLDPGIKWKVDPMATNSHVDDTTLKIIAAGSVLDDSAQSIGNVTFSVKVERRKYKGQQAGLPKVLPIAVMGLGEGPDWIEGVKQAIESTAQP
ncbi:MAG: protein kinase [Verrucomicrobiota bacterium]